MGYAAVLRSLPAVVLLGGLGLIGLLRSAADTPSANAVLEPRLRRPAALALADHGRLLFVASVWSRALTVVDLAPGVGAQDAKGPRVVKVLDLSLAPRKQLVVRDGAKVIVADAFGGRLAVVDVRRGEVESVRVLPAHNIR